MNPRRCRNMAEVKTVATWVVVVSCGTTRAVVTKIVGRASSRDEARALA